MATGVIPNPNGTWEVVKTETMTEGTLTVYRNRAKKEGLAKWQGNGTTLTPATRRFSISGLFTVLNDIIVPIYTGGSGVGHIGVDNSNVILHTTANTTWSSGCLYFPIQ